MIAELGFFSLILALCVSLALASIPKTRLERVFLFLPRWVGSLPTARGFFVSGVIGKFGIIIEAHADEEL